MLKGKVAVVTGGTRGIGYCIVKKYLENGAKVILFGSRKETVDKALDSLKAENAGWEVEGYNRGKYKFILYFHSNSSNCIGNRLFKQYS